MNLTTILAIFAVGLVCGYRLHAPLARARERYQQRRFKPQLIKRYTPRGNTSESGRDL
jgi:hypothetical protein